METELNKYYNYILLDTRFEGEWKLPNNIITKYKPFYVGKGTGYRVINHFRHNIKSDKNRYKQNTIKKIFKETLKEPQYILFNNNSSNDFACLQEILFIEYIRKEYGDILTNLTLGGENPPVYYGIENNKAKEVYQYSKIGKFLEKYNTITDAAKANNIKSKSHISGCCKGKRRTAGGFIWKYEYLGENIVINYKKYQRFVFDKLVAYNEFQKYEFESMKDAYKFLRCDNKGHINKVIKGDLKSYKGYRWEIKN